MAGERNIAGVLQGRHAACIHLEYVGKPTDEKATDAHPRTSGNGDQSLLAPAHNPQSRAGAGDHSLTYSTRPDTDLIDRSVVECDWR